MPRASGGRRTAGGPFGLSVHAGDPARLRTPLLAVLLPSGKPVPRALAALDRVTGGGIARAVRRKDFRGNRDEAFLLYAEGRGPERVLLVGLGASPDAAALLRAATLAGRRGNAMGVERMALWAEGLEDAAIENAAVGVSLGAWEFTQFRTPPPEQERAKPLIAATVCVSRTRGAAQALGRGTAVADGQRLARHLAMLPGNVCTPSYLANEARRIGRRRRLRVTVLGRREMRHLKMGSFLAVAQGTPQDPKLIVLEYRGGRRAQAPVVLVGKGLCFDSGGISIKPADRMEWMKFDMSGAAGVLGAMEAIARMKLRINVVGLIGSTTNMPSGTAMNPGDVVRASNGKTIEIVNTDAEGRLVLADVLSYAARFKPQAVVDAATLTGAVVVALGNAATGVMGNDQGLVDEVLAACKRGGEPGWQLPQWPEYKELFKSDIADMKNAGARGAGTITAALFLAEFTDYKWAHLDIAGTAYTETDLVALPRGPTGVPVRTFVEFVRGRAR
ncbi:MAG TPA: leucyl aminopeptidase [Gemmatimonadaceae bacterium]|nr:leucyl aminopeptidase [Gemmatimonadaceae bacterium]